MAKKYSAKGSRREKEPKEFEEEVLQIDRVTRVVKGGRRLRFRCTVAIGDKKGRVGIGIGKATEVVNGIKKAVTRAKKNLINVPITEDDTIPHEIRIKHKSARLLIMPASPGTGVIAGGVIRKILNLAGVKNVLSKNHGTNNKVVTAQASIMALQRLKPARKAKKQDTGKEDKQPEKAPQTDKNTSDKPKEKLDKPAEKKEPESSEKKA